MRLDRVSLPGSEGSINHQRDGGLELALHTAPSGIHSQAAQGPQGTWIQCPPEQGRDTVPGKVGVPVLESGIRGCSHPHGSEQPSTVLVDSLDWEFLSCLPHVVTLLLLTIPPG